MLTQEKVLYFKLVDVVCTLLTDFLLLTFSTAKASENHPVSYAIYNASIDNVLQTNHHTRLVHTLVGHRMRIGTPIRPSCVIFNVSSHTHKISNIFTLKMTKNRSQCFPTTFRIHSDRQYFILVHMRSDMAPMGRHWTPYLYLRGNHHEKQNIRKVANRKLQPPSSPMMMEC